MTVAENALRKLVSAGQIETAGNGPQMTQALALAVSRSMRAGFDIEGELAESEFSEHNLAGMLEGVPTPGLLVVLADNAGPAGVLWLAPLLVNALVELMTGASENAVYRVEREPTPTDAALCRDNCTRLLDLFRAELAKEGKKIPALGWQSFETEASRLGLALAGGGYSCLKGVMSLQGGVRGGQIGLALADRLVSAGAGDQAGLQAGLQDGRFAVGIWDNVQQSCLRLRVELEVMTLPLGQALALQAGDVLPVSETALSNLTLRASDGQALFKGHLGQADGRKAVSVTAVAGNRGWRSPDSSKPDGRGAPDPIPNVHPTASSGAASSGVGRDDSVPVPDDLPDGQNEGEAGATPVNLATG